MAIVIENRAMGRTDEKGTGQTSMELPTDDAEMFDELLQRIGTRTARVAVMGQGYVGLPVAMRLAEVGFPTIGFEIDQRRCQALQEGTSYVEDISDERLRAALEDAYTPTANSGDLAGIDIAVITVPTPLKDNVPDLSFVVAAGETLTGILRPGSLVILESTTYPGTTEQLLQPILERSGLNCGTEFFLGYSPERIDPGNKTWTFSNTPKIISGIDERSLQAVSAFYGTLVDEVVEVQSTATAEMVKILENTYRHVNIALVNEMAMFARDLDVDVWAAIDAAATKPFGFTPFRPGPGVGGHCLPIDPSYLSWQVRQNLGQRFRFVELANDVNEQMPEYVVSRISSLLNTHRRSVNGSKILLLGVTYKAGTSDWRESPSLKIAERLGHLGADLRLCDPHLQEVVGISSAAPIVEFSANTLSDVDLVVVLVDHDEFDPGLIAERAALVFDAKGMLHGEDFKGELL